MDIIVSCSPPLVVFLGLSALTLFGVLIHEILRRSTLFAWFCFLAPPVLSTFHWNEKYPNLDWFYWIKMFSVYFAAYWLLLFRFTSLNKSKWSHFFTYAILVVNILEAVLRVSSTGIAINQLNGLAGILLIFTIPSPFRFISVSKEKYRDFLWDIPFGWILGYTLWNTVFVYIVFPNSLGRTLSTLIATLIIAFFINRKLWIQARVFTLAIYLTLAMIFSEIGDILNFPCLKHPVLEITLSILSIAWIVSYTIWYFVITPPPKGG